MSSGAIMMVGGAGSGANVSTMTVGVTNSKGILFHGFVALPFAVPSDEATSQIGSLSPNHVTVGGANYTIHVLRTSNAGPTFTFTIADPDENLSATSVTSVITSLGTVAMSGLTFQKVTNDGANYAQWTGTGADIFGTVEDASVTVTFDV
jgi:hypothetical protein